MESITFYNNNVVGVFNYPQTSPAYHDICKYLMNCLLSYAFTKTPSVVYQNFLMEFWCTTIAYDPNPPTDDSEARPLKEYMIKFSMMNGKNPLVLDYKTFIESTGNDYAKDSSVSHPSTKNYSSTKQVNSIQQPFAYCLLTRTKDEIFESAPTILSNSNFSKDLYKVTLIELAAFMVAINNHEFSMKPLSFSIKKKKGKSQTVTPTLPQS
nr:hypothetical protein [Tanacetum cinerariifolium]